MGKTAWGRRGGGVGLNGIWGYTCGNDLSCRDSQRAAAGGWIGKTMPALPPWGRSSSRVRISTLFSRILSGSYVNGEVRQNGNVSDLIF